MAAPAARDAEAPRRLGREHGGGLAALRRERVAPPRGLGDARDEDRAEEHELVPLPRARDRGGAQAPGGDPARRRRGRAGDAPLRPAERRAQQRCARRRRRTTTATSRSPTWSPVAPTAGDARARPRGAARAARRARRALRVGARACPPTPPSCSRSAPSSATSTRRRSSADGVDPKTLANWVTQESAAADVEPAALAKLVVDGQREDRLRGGRAPGARRAGRRGRRPGRRSSSSRASAPRARTSWARSSTGRSPRTRTPSRRSRRGRARRSARSSAR